MCIDRKKARPSIMCRQTGIERRQVLTLCFVDKDRRPSSSYVIQVGQVQDTMSLLLDGWAKRVNCFPVVSAQGPASVVTFTHCWALLVKEYDGECSCRYGLCGLLRNINSIQCVPPVHSE